MPRSKPDFQAMFSGEYQLPRGFDDEEIVSDDAFAMEDDGDFGRHHYSAEAARSEESRGFAGQLPEKMTMLLSDMLDDEGFTEPVQAERKPARKSKNKREGKSKGDEDGISARATRKQDKEKMERKKKKITSRQEEEDLSSGSDSAAVEDEDEDDGEDDSDDDSEDEDEDEDEADVLMPSSGDEEDDAEDDAGRFSSLAAAVGQIGQKQRRKQQQSNDEEDDVELLSRLAERRRRGEKGAQGAEKKKQKKMSAGDGEEVEDSFVAPASAADLRARKSDRFFSRQRTGSTRGLKLSDLVSGLHDDSADESSSDSSDESDDSGDGRARDRGEEEDGEKEEGDEEEQGGVEEEEDGTRKKKQNNKKQKKRKKGKGEQSEETKLKQRLASLLTGEEGSGVVPAALPGVRVEKISRQVAYENAKEHVGRWNAIVRRNREAETLTFPLNAPKRHMPTNESLTVKFRPSTDLEQDLSSLMQQYGMDEKGTRQRESDDLAQAQALSPELVAQRRVQMRKMKALLFRSEMKNKRIKKIKSRGHRRMRREKREKKQMSLEELEELDPELGEAEREKLEYQRRKERATLRHKNTSKWVRRQLARKASALADAPEVRAAIGAQLLLGQELRKKTHTRSEIRELRQAKAQENAGDESSASGESSDSDGDVDTSGMTRVQAVRAHFAAMRKRAGLDQLGSEASNDPDHPSHTEGFADNETKRGGASGRKLSSGLLGLKFMQNARERNLREEARVLDEAERQMIEEVMQEESEEKLRSNNSKDAPPAAAAASVVEGCADRGVAACGGKKVFGPGQQQQPAAKNSAQLSKTAAQQSDDAAAAGLEAEADTTRLTRSQAAAVAREALAHGSMELRRAGRGAKAVSLNTKVSFDQDAEDEDEDSDAEEEGGASNPWAQDASNPRKTPRTQPKKPGGSSRSARDGGSSDEDDDDEDDINDAAARVRKLKERIAQKTGNAAGKKQNARSSRKRARGSDDDGEMEGDDLLDVNASLLPDTASGSTGEVDLLSTGDSQQARFVRQAFSSSTQAEDEMAAEKRRQVERALPSSVTAPASLPGWGSWAGEGLQNLPPSRRQLKRQAVRESRIAKARNKLLSKRRDAKLKNVIISEKRQKSALKYKLPQLPFPYTSREQYERAMRAPLGPDWNAGDAHESLVKPRVIVRQGANIEPIRFNARTALNKNQTKKRRDRQAKKRRLNE